MHHKTAILVDGGWMALELAKLLHQKYATADQVYRNAKSVLLPDEMLYRIFYYDASPYGGIQKNPISQNSTDFAALPSFGGREKFFRELNSMPQIALRLGTLNFRGWKIVDQFHNDLLSGHAPATSVTAHDIKPNFMQKGVDMKIGIDIASLVFKKLVDRIVLFCGDTDMLPAMKMARVEGVQIVVVQMGTARLNNHLIADSDFLRTLVVQP